MSEDPVLTAIAKLREDLIGMINLGNERVLNRLTAIEGELRNLRSEHSVTRDLVTRLPATVLGAIEKPLLNRITDIEDRVSKIEDKAP